LFYVARGRLKTSKFLIHSNKKLDEKRLFQTKSCVFPFSTLQDLNLSLSQKSEISISQNDEYDTPHLLKKIVSLNECVILTECVTL